MAEGYATVHAAACLQFAFASVERLLYLAKVVDSIVNRTVTRLKNAFGFPIFLIDN